MNKRRLAYWWFRFVVSGRFLDKFMDLQPPRRTQFHGRQEWKPDFSKAARANETTEPDDELIGSHRVQVA